MRELPHSVVQQRDERVERIGITLRPSKKELGDVAWSRLNVCGKSQGEGKEVDHRELRPVSAAFKRPTGCLSRFDRGFRYLSVDVAYGSRQRATSRSTMRNDSSRGRARRLGAS